MGNINYNDAALSNQKLPVQVSEAANNTPPFVDVIEEMSKPYVQYCKQVYPDEEVETAIRYLNTLGGISQHRNHTNLLNAIKHVRHMRKKKRINDLGLPDDFSREKLVEVFGRTRSFEMDDVMYAVNQCLAGGFFPDPYECAEKILELKNIGFLSDPYECAEKIRVMKDIEELRNEVGEKRTELIHSSDVFARSQSVMIQELVMRDLQVKLRRNERTIREQQIELRHYQD